MSIDSWGLGGDVLPTNDRAQTRHRSSHDADRRRSVGAIDRRQHFEPRAASVRAARRLVADVLASAGYQGDVDTVLLLVSEVTTNAVRHARTSFELIVSVDSTQVRVTVVDHDRAHLPKVQDPSPEATSGRGLLIVERLATSWGYEDSEDDAKAVWFSVS